MGRDLGIADRLRAAGLNVVEVDGWQSRGSDSFDPRGGVDHHTAGSNNGNAPSLDVCTNGREGLSGPLCNTLQGFDGTQYVIASGRANHAGEGSWHGLSGNSSVYGMERENTGHDPARPGQHDSAARAWAAILNGSPFGNIDAGMVCGHKEWSPGRKPDFHDVTYDAFRDQIAHGSQPPPPPELPEGVPDMHVVISGVSCFAMFNGVAFKFHDWNTFTASRSASQDVPMSVISDTEPLASRQWLHATLEQQSLNAVGADPFPDA